MNIEHHIFDQGDKKKCKRCKRPFDECMSWVNIWSIRGMPERRLSKLGLGTKASKLTDFGPELIFESVSQVGPNIKINILENTKHNSYLLTPSGKLLFWGINFKGGKSTDQLLFLPLTPVKELGALIIVYLSCGDEHILALESSMYLWSWGSNLKGQLGRKGAPHIPTRINTINNIARIEAGSYSSYACNLKGVVYVWGENHLGQLGYLEKGNESFESLKKPIELAEMPWNFKMNLGVESRHYYKSMVKREIFEEGLSRREIRATEMENEQLRIKLEYIRRKVILLQDELNVNTNEELNVLWNKDEDIIKIRTLIKNAQNNNQQIKNKIKTYINEMNKVKEELEVLKERSLEVDALVVEKRKFISMQEEEIEELNSQLEFANNSKMENNIEENINAAKNLLERFQVEMTVSSNEKKQISKRIETLQQNRIKYESLITELDGRQDKNEEDYRNMEMVKKKYLTEMFLEANRNSFYKRTKNLIGYSTLINKCGPENLSKILSPNLKPREVIEISTRVLTQLRVELSQLLQIHEITYSTKLNDVWRVLLENIDFKLKINETTYMLTKSLREKLESMETPEKPNQKAEDLFAVELNKSLNNLIKESGLNTWINEESKFEEKLKKFEKFKKKMGIKEEKEETKGWKFFKF